MSDFFRASRRPDKLMTECKACTYAYRDEWGKKRSIVPHKDIKKICTGCKIEKPLSEFYNDKKGLYGKGYKCALCNDSHGKKYAVNNVEKVRQYRRKRFLKANYSMTVETFEALLSSQGGKCAICRKVLVKNIKNKASTHVDHDHNTGAVRGILCAHCNSGLGYFRDNMEFMESAIKYLKDRGS